MVVHYFQSFAPALAPAAMFLIGLAWFSRASIGNLVISRPTTFIAGPLVTRYVLWLLKPVELLLVKVAVSPNQLTITSLGMCIASGAVAASGHFILAAWLYFGAGFLDILDGRVARRTKRASRAGAFLDSVLDRWGELALLGGIFLTMTQRGGQLAILICIAGSQMVSYTRARGEALGVVILGGTMQRAERILLVGIALLIGGLGGRSGLYDGETILALALGAVGLGACATALYRLAWGLRALRRHEVEDRSESPSIDEHGKPWP